MAPAAQDRPMVARAELGEPADPVVMVVFTRPETTAKMVRTAFVVIQALLARLARPGDWVPARLRQPRAAKEEQPAPATHSVFMAKGATVDPTHMVAERTAIPGKHLGQ